MVSMRATKERSRVVVVRDVVGDFHDVCKTRDRLVRHLPADAAEHTPHFDFWITAKFSSDISVCMPVEAADMSIWAQGSTFKDGCKLSEM